MSPRLTTVEAAKVAHRHPETLLLALQSGSLHGRQRAKRGPWLIKEECLDAWLDGTPCEHQAAAAAVPSLDDRRARTTA